MNRTADPSLDSSPLLHIHHAASMVSVVLCLCGSKNFLHPKSLLSSDKPSLDNNCRV